MIKYEIVVKEFKSSKTQRVIKCVNAIEGLDQQSIITRLFDYAMNLNHIYEINILRDGETILNITK